jgi:hypothetical protein
MGTKIRLCIIENFSVLYIIRFLIIDNTSQISRKRGENKKRGQNLALFLSIIYNKNAVLYIIRLGSCIMEIPDNERNRSKIFGELNISIGDRKITKTSSTWQLRK